MAKRGWGSPGCELHSQNLKGPREAEKQASWDSTRIWWAPMLMRGKLHVEVFDADFPGETEQGARQLVEKVRTSVNKRFQDGSPQPRILWTDRGKGFYVPSSGVITSGYKEALRRCRFKAMFGDDASAQPGKLQELMLHETAVSWLRLRLARSVPSRPWLETRAEYEARLKQCCDDVNLNLKVAGLCRALNSRIDALLRSEGGRLPQ